MEASTVIKRQFDYAQKYYWGASVVIIDSIAVSTMTEKKNNKFESIIKTNEGGGGVNPSGDV